jgi:hypothetical protein
MDPMWDVFIAYSSSDRAVASRLADALGNRLRVFIDIYCLRPGDDWDIALRAAVEDAAMVVVLVSPSTEQSFFQRDEILRAVERSRKDPPRARLIPIFIGGTAPTQPSVPYGLRPKQGIVIANEDDLNAAAERIIELAVAPILKDADDESRQMSPSLRAFFAGLHQDVQQLTQDQYRVIQQLRYLRRVRISGCAGSGKTLVAAEKGSRLSAAGLRVLLVCHNPLLAEHIGRLVAGTGTEVADFVSWLSTIAGIRDDVRRQIGAISMSPTKPRLIERWSPSVIPT